MTPPVPYLSVIVTSRNDDHGGSMLRRMQTFVNGLVGQCKRHNLDVELLFVEWNPPADRPPLVDALVWPDDLGPCQVRVVRVPPEVHARYPYAANLPLFQMIAKNYGIRRARGEFLLITNIDILLSDELCEFLAARRLRKGVLYRIDRTDVDADVPVFGSVDEQLEYCRTNQLRNNALVGTLQLNPDGSIWADPLTRDGVRLGEGWCRIEQNGEDWFTWLTEAGGEVIVPPGAPRYLWLDLEIGPSARRGRFTVRVVGPDGRDLVHREVRVRQVVCVEIPPSESPITVRVIASGDPAPIPGDPRALFARLWAAGMIDRYDPRPYHFSGTDTDHLIVHAPGVRLLAGWARPEPDRDEHFVWAYGPAELGIGDGAPPYLWLDLQVGPSADWKTLTLRAEDDAGTRLGEYELVARCGICLPLAGLAGRTVRLIPVGGDKALRNDPRTLPFRLHAAVPVDGHDPRPAAALPADRRVLPEGVRLGGGWDRVEPDRDEHFVWARGPAELRIDRPAGRFLYLDVQTGPSAEWGRLPLRIVDDAGTELARPELVSRQPVWLPTDGLAGRTIRLEPVGGDRPLPGDPRRLPFRLYHAGWADEYDPRPDAAGDDRVVRADGLRLRDGWARVEPDRDEHFVWAYGPAELAVTRPGDDYLLLDIQVGPAAGWGRLALRVTADDGREIARRDVVARESICLPVAGLAGRTLRLEPVGADTPTSGDLRALPFRLYAARWADRGDARPDPAADRHVVRAAGARLGAGWDRVEPDRDEHFAWARGPAGISIPADPGGAYVSLDVQAGPSAGWARLGLRVVDAGGEELARCEVVARQTICLPTAALAGRSVRLEPIGADAPAPGDVRALPFRLFSMRWADRYDPRSDSVADRHVVRAAGVRLLDGWDQVEPEHGEHFVWARGPAGLAIDHPGGGYLWLDVQAGPSAGWRKVTLAVVAGSGREIARRDVVVRQPVCIPIPADEAGDLRLVPVGADTPLPNDPRLLPFRVYEVRWADRYDPRPDSAADRRVIQADGVRFLDGWGPVESPAEGDFVWAYGPAELAVDAIGADYLWLDVHVGPSAGRGWLALTIRADDGRVIARREVVAAQPVCLPVAGLAGRRIRLEPEGADDPIEGELRVLPFRVLGVRWAERYDPRPLDRAGTPADAVVVHAPGVRLLDGWGRLEGDAAGAWISAYGPAELELGPADPRRAGPSLALTLDPPPGWNGHPVEVRVTDDRGRVLADCSLEGRTTVFLDRLPHPDGPGLLRVEPDDPAKGPDRQPLFRLRSAVWVPGPLARRMTGGVRKVRRVVGRVRQLIHRSAAPPTERIAQVVEPTELPSREEVSPPTPVAPPPGPPPAPVAATPAKEVLPVWKRADWYDPAGDPLYYDPPPVVVPECVADGRVPVGHVAPWLLHLNACGDFHLLSKDDCLAVRGYAEFPVYSLNIDSLFSYTLAAVGVVEEILRPPMYAYHIEHNKGSGATPEGIDLLLDRMRQRGIPVVDFRQVSAWGTEMRNAGGPILFNDETWGLPDVELPEMTPADRTRTS